jgi:hypothetical protein
MSARNEIEFQAYFATQVQAVLSAHAVSAVSASLLLNPG